MYPPFSAELAGYDRLDTACEGLPEAAMRRAEEAFITSSRWELTFWEMAWTGEKWPA